MSTATGPQMDTLLSFLEIHKELARPTVGNAIERSRSKILWRRLTNELNSLGGCVKNVKQWQKVWADRKYLTKKTLACIKSGKMSYGLLSAQETRVIALIEDDNNLQKTDERKSIMDIDIGNDTELSEPEKYVEESNVTISNITTSEQLEALLTFLERNPCLVKSPAKDVTTRHQAKILWDSVTSELNVMQGCVKNCKQWQKVWADRKYLAKKALLNCKRTGSNPADELSPQELRIMSIVEEGGHTEPEVDDGPDFRPIYIIARERKTVDKGETPQPHSPELSLSYTPQIEIGNETARLCDENVSEHSRNSTSPNENDVNNRLIQLEERRLEIEIQQGNELSQIRQELSQLRQAVQELVGIFKGSVR